MDDLLARVRRRAVRSKKAESNMVEIEDLKRAIKVCMFDQYDTVVHMQTGLTEIATPYLKANGWTGNPYSFVMRWRRTHFENSMIDALRHKEHTPYREIGHHSVAFVLERGGITYTMEEVARPRRRNRGSGIGANPLRLDRIASQDRGKTVTV
jgi:hypothetical protein